MYALDVSVYLKGFLTRVLAHTLLPSSAFRITVRGSRDKG